MPKEAQTVLVIDDEEEFLTVCQELLETFGYRVLIAQEGKEGIQIYSQNREDIDIVLLDMVLLDMDSREIYDRLKEVNPDIKVLLITGYAVQGHNKAREILERGCDGFMQKPFNITELSQKIGEVLNKQ